MLGKAYFLSSDQACQSHAQMTFRKPGTLPCLLFALELKIGCELIFHGQLDLFKFSVVVQSYIPKKTLRLKVCIFHLFTSE